MAEVTYYVALPFVAADDGIAAGEPTECFNPNTAVIRAEALSRKEGHVGAVAFSRTGDRRRMMQWWADHITAMALRSDNIVPLSRASELARAEPCSVIARCVKATTPTLKHFFNGRFDDEDGAAESGTDC